MREALQNIWIIAKREFAGYFATPIAMVFLIIFVALTGAFAFYVGAFFERGQAELSSFFNYHPWLYLLLVPAIGMRLWAEERRVGTIELLLTMPITEWQAIIGKFLASWLFLGVALLLTFPIVFTVNYLGSPDNGVIFAAYVGSWLMAGAYLAISCVTSALTRNQVVSFILAVAACFVLILCSFSIITGFLQSLNVPGLVEFVASLSFITHYDGFQRGVLDSRDVIFFLSLIGFSLFTTGVILRSHRAG